MDKCGDCEYWMCKSLCPHEHGFEARDENGKLIKNPSCDSFICEKFKKKVYDTLKN